MKIVKREQAFNIVSIKPHSWTAFSGDTTQEKAEEEELLAIVEKVEEETHQAVIEEMIEAKKVEREEIEVKSKKEEILEQTKIQAQTQAQVILEEAKQQSDKVKEEAFQKGVQEGSLEAEKKAEEKYSALFSQEVDKLKNVEKALENSYQEIVKNTEDKIVRLALDVAKKILKEECKKKGAVVAKMVKEGLSRLTERGSVKIRLNPQDLPAIERNKKKLTTEFSNAQAIELISDGKVLPGGCIVETGSGSIDLRIDRQFSEVKRNLTGQSQGGNDFESDN